MAIQNRFRLSRTVVEHLIIGGFFALLAALSFADPASAAAAGAGTATSGEACSGEACGASVMQLSRGLLIYAFITAAAGIIVSAILWALGSKGQNPGTELAGKRGMIVCCSAAFLMGALPAWLETLRNIAQDVRTN